MNKDLKWLAENVHEWPEGYATLVKQGEYGLFFKPFDRPAYYRLHQYFHEKEWQSARDELSGKPSWDDVVGEWIAQDSNGEWYSFDNMPHCSERYWHGSPCRREGSGKVLGDWHNTLEQRPENHSVEPTEKVWRGPEDGLPPVGTESEARIVDEWHEGEIVAHARGHAILMTEHDDTFALNKSSDFRPLRSEEDKVIQEMLCIMEGGAGERAARALYRAGYRQQVDDAVGFTLGPRWMHTWSCQ